MKFSHEWWSAAEVLFAVASFGGEEDFGDAVKSWRKSQIGRKNVLRAKDFDNAARGVRTAMAGHAESVETTLERARWHIVHGIPPTFARPAGWEWGDGELEVIRISRARGIEPVFLSFDTSGIDPVPGPGTKPNPWDKWRKL